MTHHCSKFANTIFMSLNYEITQAKINVMNALLENKAKNEFEVWVQSVETPDGLTSWLAMLFVSPELAPLTNVIEYLPKETKAINLRNLDGSANYHLFFKITSHKQDQLGAVITHIEKTLPELIVQLREEIAETEREEAEHDEIHTPSE